MPLVVFADASTDAFNAREQALQALKGFNPASVLKDYTTNPGESLLAPTENNNGLAGQGVDALKNNPAAGDVFQAATSREQVKSNPASPEMRYAENLLENPDSVLEGACYKEPAACETKTDTKNCIDTIRYNPILCNRKLVVNLKYTTQNVQRNFSTFNSELTFNLTLCASGEKYCNKARLATITEPCEALLVSIIRNGQTVPVIKQPSCNDPTVTVQLSGYTTSYIPFEISLSQYTSEDSWQSNDCNSVQIQASKGSCVLEAAVQCLEPNAVKNINGVGIKRPCWGEQWRYQCSEISNSTCSTLINQGCSQTASICTLANNNRCERYSQTFQCTENFCMPEKTICPGKMACTDGECDTSVSEVSDDIQDGISKLGALAGVAGDVSANQVQNGVPAIFTGKAKECKKFPWGIRDCCTDSGWGDWVKNCPADLKELQRAKHENRVVYIGNYKNHKLGSRHYSYCVFPSKLSGIVQIQGRGGQLGISYGSAEFPDCRGLTPDELEHINFAALDLSDIQQELIARMALPANGQMSANNQAHIEQLNRESLPHD